jgi:hypothetical protein
VTRTLTWRARASLAALLPLAATLVTGTAPSAGATTPGYTVTTGAKGSYAHVDDTPSYVFTDKNGQFYFQQSHSLYGATTDKNGQFYFQQSHSLYGATAGRKWSFYTGTNATYDTAAFDTALDTGNNHDTTAFCNNSPTGLQSTYLTGSTSYAERNYCDLTGVWVDPDSGDWYGLVHNEFTPSPFGDGTHYDAIDYAVSTDQGATWTIKDHVITSPFSTTRGDTNTTNGFPNQTYYFGDGDPRMYVDYASGYFYVFYETQVLNKAGGGRVDLGHVARAPISQKMAPSSWQKWYGGSWAQPGVGGKESDLVALDPTGATGNSTGYITDPYSPANTGTTAQEQAAGQLTTLPSLAYMSVSWNAYLGKFVATPKAEASEATGTNPPQHIYVSSDLATEQWTEIGTSAEPVGTGWYRWRMDGVSATSTDVQGKTYRSYCAYSCYTNGTTTTGAEYVDTTIDTSAANLPAYVDPAKQFQIAAGNGQYLAQSGTALTTTTAGGSSSAQQWTFSPTGDGFFTVANAGSRSVLAVDDTADAGRAWGAAATLSTLGTTPSVGQEWAVMPVVNGSTPTGAYRLVNRYSHLALSLTSGSAATAPQRTWDNTGTAGDTSAQTAQLLTFSASTNAPNLIPAGDFESGNLTGWSVHNATVVTDPAAHSPSHDLQLKSPAGDYATMEYTVTGLQPNTTYTYTAWARADSAAYVSVGVKNFGGTQVTTHVAATGWTQVTDTFTTGATNTSATVFCYLPSASSTSTCDDLSLTVG